MKDEQLTEAVITTHGGSFHADDVFAVAALLILLEPRRVISRTVRSRNEKDWEKADFVVDVGGEYNEAKNRFDHHQIGGAGARPNGVPYAAFGLVWKKFGKDVCLAVPTKVGTADPVLVAEKIDKSLVQFIDVMDNGMGGQKPIFSNVYSYSVKTIIDNLNPNWLDTNQDFDGLFCEAVAFAKNILRREISISRAFVEGSDLVERSYKGASDKRIIVLDKEYQWEGILENYPEPLFVILPRSDNSGRVVWRVGAVRDDPESFANRRDFPESWSGKRDGELAEITGVSDAIFCHYKRFVVYAGSKEGAISLAEKALQA